MNINGLDKLQEGLEKAVQKGVDELNKGLDRINNPEKKESVPSVCPHCSAHLNISSDDPVITCEYCGAQFDNTQNKTVVDSVIDFVEKQQAIAEEAIANKASADAKKELERQQRKAKRRIRRTVKRIIFLIVLLAFAYYYVNNKAIVDAAISPVINQIGVIGQNVLMANPNR